MSAEIGLSLADNINEMYKMMAGVGLVDIASADQVFGGLQDVFDVQQAASLAQYLFTSLFQHYHLYLSVFSCKQEHHVVGIDISLEVSPTTVWPPPLTEAIPESMYARYVQGQDNKEFPTPEETSEGQTAEEPPDPLTQLTPVQIRRIIDEVFKEQLVGISDEITGKMRVKEKEFLDRIAKVHITEKQSWLDDFVCADIFKTYRQRNDVL